MEVLNNYMESASVQRICWCTGFRKATPTAVVTFSFPLFVFFFFSPNSQGKAEENGTVLLKSSPLYVRLFSSFSFFSFLFFVQQYVSFRGLPSPF